MFIQSHLLGPDYMLSAELAPGNAGKKLPSLGSLVL